MGRQQCGPGRNRSRVLTLVAGEARRSELCDFVGVCACRTDEGRKDRHVMPSPSPLNLWRDQSREARSAGWLVPSRNRGDSISTRRLNRAFGVARDFAGIKKEGIAAHAQGQLRQAFRTRYQTEPVQCGSMATSSTVLPSGSKVKTPRQPTQSKYSTL